jgi:hypothetical protein
MKHKYWIGYLALVLMLVTTGIGTGEQIVRAQQPNRVAVIVQHGDGSVITRCVEFGEPEITGYDVLTRAGFEVAANFDSGFGAGVCAIDGEGCPADNCFCQCQGSPCLYWIYHHLVNGQWVYSNVGASTYTVQNGDVEGWAWGEGSPEGGAQPPVIPFDQICAPPATDTPAPTATPIPPTATPVPPTAPPTSPTPPEVWFRLDENPIPAGTCTTVRWDTARAQEVYLDEEPVSAVGSLEVCPTEPQTYLLRVVGAEDETTYELVLGITGDAPATATPTSSAPAAAAASPTPESDEATPSPSPTSPPASTPTPTLTIDPTTTSPSPSPTPAPAQTTPSPTPIPVAEAGDTPTATEPPAASDGEPPTSPRIPLGYIAFGLIAVSLVGWLVLETRRRKR